MLVVVSRRSLVFGSINQPYSAFRTAISETNRMASQPIPKDELELYRQRPELIEAIGSRRVIHQVFLAAVFAAGLVLVVLAKRLKFAPAGSVTPWLMETAVDLLFELGVAL